EIEDEELVARRRKRRQQAEEGLLARLPGAWRRREPRERHVWRVGHQVELGEVHRRVLDARREDDERGGVDEAVQAADRSVLPEPGDPTAVGRDELAVPVGELEIGGQVRLRAIV